MKTPNSNLQKKIIKSRKSFLKDFPKFPISEDFLKFQISEDSLKFQISEDSLS